MFLSCSYAHARVLNIVKLLMHYIEKYLMDSHLTCSIGTTLNSAIK